jgi:hypothetical protein
MTDILDILISVVVVGATILVLVVGIALTLSLNPIVIREDCYAQTSKNTEYDRNMKSICRKTKRKGLKFDECAGY